MNESSKFPARISIGRPGTQDTGFRIYGPRRDQTEVDHIAEMTILPKKSNV